MIKINITKEEIELAKKITADFDKQKTYNKFSCSTNYIGVLGEMVLDRYLTENNVTHTWVEFNKKGWTDPDFIIGGKSIDLKTTFSDGMWFQKTQFDAYVYAKISFDETYLTLGGWIDKAKLELFKTNGVAKKIDREHRVDYILHPNEMKQLHNIIETSFGGVSSELQN